MSAQPPRPAPSIEYLAGYLDGEGCFTTDGRIAAVSTDREVLEDLAAAYGGRVTGHQASSPRSAESWQWRVPRKTCAVLIPRLLPHLRTKSPVAGLAARLAALPRLHDRCPCDRCARITAERDELRDGITALNRRGAVLD